MQQNLSGLDSNEKPFDLLDYTPLEIHKIYNYYPELSQDGNKIYMNLPAREFSDNTFARASNMVIEFKELDKDYYIVSVNDDDTVEMPKYAFPVVMALVFKTGLNIRHINSKYYTEVFNNIILANTEEEYQEKTFDFLEYVNAITGSGPPYIPIYNHIPILTQLMKAGIINDKSLTS